jgi:uncharacterized protein YggE
MIRGLRASLLAVVVCACTRAPVAAGRDDAPPHGGGRSVTVSGSGTCLAAPTRADFDALVVTEGPAPELAWQQGVERIHELARTLEAAGVRATEMAVHTGTLLATTKGYRLEQRLRVSVRDLQRMAPVLANALGGGADSLLGLTYTLDDPRAAGDRARERALLAARQKAEMLAQELELTLGPVLSVTELPGPEPVGSGALQAPPAAIEVSSTLQVTFQLLD